MVNNFIEKKLRHRLFPLRFPKFIRRSIYRIYPNGCLNEMNQKSYVYKIYSQENTGEDVLFRAVADMWAYSFSKRDSIINAFL